MPFLGSTPYSVGPAKPKIPGKHPRASAPCRAYRFPPLTESPLMAKLNATFDAAVANSKNLSERPDNATLLKIYALYKQGTVGDNTEKKPGFTDMVGRAKWDAWNKLNGTDSDDAKQQYIDLIESLS
jgi:diazepam-binding inhibitor (GABA receptor modulating acyl-CoA-binding protein)